MLAIMLAGASLAEASFAGDPSLADAHQALGLSSAPCARPLGVPADAFEVTSAFSGKFRSIPTAGGTNLEPVFEDVAAGTLYNRAVVNVIEGARDPAFPRVALTRRGLEAGTYYRVWTVTPDPECALLEAPYSFVPEIIRLRLGLPAAEETIREPASASTATPSPSPTSSPSPTPTATQAPTPTPVSTPTPTSIPTSTPLADGESPTPCSGADPTTGACPGDASLTLALLLGALWIGGVLENRFSRQYRMASH